MAKVKKERIKRTPEQQKELNWKIAEIIWYSIGGIIMLGGLVFSVLGLLIMNMNENFNHHAFYPLYKAQGEFFAWLGFGSTYANAGLVLILVGLVYFLIVIYAFANFSDVKSKKQAARVERKKNLKLILDQEETKEEIAE